jgi:hypothetical protein
VSKLRNHFGLYHIYCSERHMDHPTNEIQDETEGSKQSQTQYLKDGKLKEESSPATRGLALETSEQWEEATLPEVRPHPHWTYSTLTTSAKGFIGTVIKVILGTTPIWVVNRHVEDIIVTVTVPRLDPLRFDPLQFQSGSSTSNFSVCVSEPLHIDCY